jgi:hypothetical protein
MLKPFASGLGLFEVSLHILALLYVGSSTQITEKIRKKHKWIEPQNNFYFTRTILISG